MELRVETGTIEGSARRSRGQQFLCACLIVACLLTSARPASAQHTTVRRHQVEEQDPAAAKISAAEASIEKQDYAAAESTLKEVVAAQPGNHTAWYDLGFIYHALHREDESIAAYRKSVEARPNVFESNLNLGMALAQAGQPEAAEQYLRAATSLTPSSQPLRGRKEAWLALGHVLENSKPQESAHAYLQASVVDPKDPEPHLLAGAALERAQKPEAEQEYRAALAIDPRSSAAMTALSNYYMAHHRFADAEATLRRLAETETGNPGAHIQLGRMLAIAGKNEEAAAELEAGLKLDPNDATAQRDLAEIYADLQQFGEAEHIYGSLIAASPSDASLHHQLGRVLLRDKKFTASQKELMQAIQLKPDLGEAYGDLAIAANEDKNYPLTLKALDLRGKLLPENALTYFLRATAYDHTHDAKNAAKYYHEFLDSAGGKYPDQEWQAKHRLIAIEPKK